MQQQNLKDNGMKKEVSVSAFLVLAGFASTFALATEPPCSAAWSKRTQDQCNAGGTQDMTRCLGTKLREADKELNKVYAGLKADLVEPSAVTRAQRSWVAYRNAECTYQSSGYACDSGTSGMCSLSSGFCQMQLTCERVNLLRKHIEAKCNGCPVRKSDGSK